MGQEHQDYASLSAIKVPNNNIFISQNEEVIDSRKNTPFDLYQLKQEISEKMKMSEIINTEFTSFKSTRKSCTQEDYEEGNDINKQLIDFDFVPIVALKHIFQFLPVDDLRIVQYVSPHWFLASQDCELWKNVTYNVGFASWNNMNNILTKLQTMPLLKNITGFLHEGCSTSVIDSLCMNIKDLRKINFCSRPPISTSEFFKLCETFQNLESITLDVSANDFLISLKYVSTLETLKELIFSYYNGYKCFSYAMADEISNIISSGFPALQKLDMKFCELSISNKAMIDILKSKAQQLKVIPPVYSQNVDPSVFNAIAECTALEHLEISFSDLDYQIDYTKLRQLKSLSIRVAFSSAMSLYDNVYKPLVCNLLSNLQKLEIVLFGSVNNLPILEEICHRLHNLRYLKLACNEGYRINVQLAELRHLPKLTSLRLDHYIKLLDEGVECISRCKSLTSISLIDCPSLTDAALKHFQTCHMIEKMILTDCRFEPNSIISTVLSMERLKSVYLINCKISFKEKRYIMKQLEIEGKKVHLEMIC